MFAILATKPLNDRTKGFRFNVMGQKGLVRRRKAKSNGFKLDAGPCMAKLHLGRITVYLESKATVRALHHFAG